MDPGATRLSLQPGDSSDPQRRGFCTSLRGLSTNIWVSEFSPWYQVSVDSWLKCPNTLDRWLITWKICSPGTGHNVNFWDGRTCWGPMGGWYTIQIDQPFAGRQTVRSKKLGSSFIIFCRHSCDTRLPRLRPKKWEYHQKKSDLYRSLKTGNS